MNGIHDLGGMHGLGKVVAEHDEPVFHHPWERRVFALLVSTFGAGHYNVDQFRHAIERMRPQEYLATSYYEHWLHAIETVLVERGIIDRAELEARWASAKIKETA
jgi:nitrile hydratase subunit beta